jgi:hypothetical protein
MSRPLSQLDANQVIRKAGLSLSDNVIPNGGLGVLSVGGTLVPERYDALELTYITEGNGEGEIGQVVYKLDNSIVATLVLNYDIDNRIINVVRS